MKNRAALETLEATVDKAVATAIDAGCDPENVEKVLQHHAQLMREFAAEQD